MRDFHVNFLLVAQPTRLPHHSARRKDDKFRNSNLLIDLQSQVFHSIGFNLKEGLQNS